MRINFRQGIVSHQPGGFLQFNGSGNVDILAVHKSVTVSIAHQHTNYIHSEDNTVPSAWVGPFEPSLDYWLFWDFDKTTFERTFGLTTIQPIAQSRIPGYGDVPIAAVTNATNPNTGSFVVSGNFVWVPGRQFAIVGSTGNNGTYTVLEAVYDSTSYQTTIYVQEPVPSPIANGKATLDIDSAGDPLRVVGRMWYDTANSKQFIWTGTHWMEVIRVLAGAVVAGNTFTSPSIVQLTPGAFTGTQIGDNTQVYAGRILYTQTGAPIQRSDGTWITTEDEFFTNQSRVDGLRLESTAVSVRSSDSSIAQYHPVAWNPDGTIRAAQYDDISNAIIGMLTEDLMYGDIGGVILQGVVTNPMWNWTVPIGSELWIESGELVPYDPHLTSPLSNLIGRVPVARVLSSDTIIFDQGLGGKGERGPAGSINDLPPATPGVTGAVRLSVTAVNETLPIAVGDNDSRMTDARTPLAHSHSGTQVSITPTGSVTATNAQTAIAQLATDKVNKAGDTMTGQLTLVGMPSSDLHAATKKYVDSLVNGLRWLDPISMLNLISDTITTPPGSPQYSDAYIIPPSATGDWSALSVGNVVEWDGTDWLDRGPISGMTHTRFGISMSSSTTPSGSFIGRANQIAQYTSLGIFELFQTPVANDAVYVAGTASLHAFDSYAFNGTNWILFGGADPITPDNTTVQINGGIISAIPHTGQGGTIDAKFLQGQSLNDLDGRYAPATHTHSESDITDLDKYTQQQVDDMVGDCVFGPGLSIEIVASMPITPDPNTIYFVTA